MELPLTPSTYARLYEEADSQPLGDPGKVEQELSPLFHALEQVEERYVGEEPIGKGGMKEVVRVYDERTERHVALARPKEGVGEERYDSFLREAHITARLEHPNIIKLFDMGIDGQRRPFFTMEFKQGKSLRRMLTALKKDEDGAEGFSYEVRLSAFLRICDAMAYAHSRRVLHLDLKPENIQIGTFGEVQVCDWGMGEVERGDHEDLASVALLDPDLYGDQLGGAVKGTPGYMAPEQKDPREAKTTRTDIHALGCMLYELSTLRLPTKRAEEPVSSPGVAAIVEKATTEGPEDRYQTVGEMRDDVSRHLSGYSAQVEQAGFFRETRLFYRRNRVPCQIALVALLLLAAVGIWFNLQLGEGYRRTTHALGQVRAALVIAEEAKVSEAAERSRAELARDRAEEALAKYERERKYAAVLLKRNAEEIGESSLLLDFLIMNEAISLTAVENAMKGMDQILAKNPPASNQIWAQKAYTLFLTQRFAEAEKFYAIRQGTQKDLRDLIPVFAPLVDDSGLLPVEEFIRLIKRLFRGKVDRVPLIEKMVIYDSLKRESLEDEARVLKFVLGLSNPNWKKPVFDFDLESRHLAIGGEGLKTLYRPRVAEVGSEFPSYCLLRLLGLRSMALGSSDFDRLEELDGLRLERLDLRGSKVSDLTPLASMSSLRELVLEPGHLEAAERAMLPEHIDVIIEP